MLCYLVILELRNRSTFHLRYCFKFYSSIFHYVPGHIAYIPVSIFVGNFSHQYCIDCGRHFRVYVIRNRTDFDLDETRLRDGDVKKVTV